MIDEDDMMDVLLEACPSFTPQWHEFYEEWKDDPEGVPLYVILADFARHLIGFLERGATDELSRVFQTIESLLLEGDNWVKDATAVGILESLQNWNLHERTSPEQFRPYLGPTSARTWDELIADWEACFRAQEEQARNQTNRGES